MKKKSLFRRVSGVLTGVFFSTSLILAANENGQLFGSETLIVVVALLLLFVPLFLYVRKLHSNMNDRSDRIIKENAALESLNKEISSRNEEVNTRNEELDSRNKSLEGQIEQQEERYRVLREQNDDLAKANSDLVRKNNELELVISTLNNNKKELEQLIVTKIKENDMIQREAADKLAEAEKRLKDAESINDNFFIETIHEMRTPLSLVLGSLALVVQNDDPEKDMSTQLLYTCHAGLGGPVDRYAPFERCRQLFAHCPLRYGRDCPPDLRYLCRLGSHEQRRFPYQHADTRPLGLDGPSQDGVRSAYVTVECLQKYVCLWESDT